MKAMTVADLGLCGVLKIHPPQTHPSLSSKHGHLSFWQPFPIWDQKGCPVPFEGFVQFGHQRSPAQPRGNLQMAKLTHMGKLLLVGRGNQMKPPCVIQFLFAVGPTSAFFQYVRMSAKWIFSQAMSFRFPEANWNCPVRERWQTNRVI